MMHVNIHKQVSKFLSSLDEQLYAKSIHAIELLKNFGSQLALPHSKQVSRGIFELRVLGRREIRIMYCFHQDTAYLLSAFAKKTLKIPQRELRIAKARYKMLTMI